MQGRARSRLPSRDLLRPGLGLAPGKRARGGLRRAGRRARDQRGGNPAYWWAEAAPLPGGQQVERQSRKSTPAQGLRSYPPSPMLAGARPRPAPPAPRLRAPAALALPAASPDPAVGEPAPSPGLPSLSSPARSAAPLRRFRPLRPPRFRSARAAGSWRRRLRVLCLWCAHGAPEFTPPIAVEWRTPARNRTRSRPGPLGARLL